MASSEASSSTDPRRAADGLPPQQGHERDAAEPATGSNVEAWVRRHQVRAWRYIRLRGAPPDLADDLIQEALLAGVRKRVHEAEDERAAAWLRAALDNLWRMHLRSEGRRQHHLEAAIAERALQLAGTDDGATWLLALRSCLQQVDGRTRQLLQLHYGADASRDAIAERLGMRANGVKAFLRRVRDALRRCVLQRLRREERSER